MNDLEQFFKLSEQLQRDTFDNMSEDARIIVANAMHTAIRKNKLKDVVFDDFPRYAEVMDCIIANYLGFFWKDNVSAKVWAIKYFRDHSGQSLLISKTYIEFLMADMVLDSPKFDKAMYVYLISRGFTPSRTR